MNIYIYIYNSQFQVLIRHVKSIKLRHSLLSIDPVIYSSFFCHEYSECDNVKFCIKQIHLLYPIQSFSYFHYIFYGVFFLFLFMHLQLSISMIKPRGIGLQYSRCIRIIITIKNISQFRDKENLHLYRHPKKIHFHLKNKARSHVLS